MVACRRENYRYHVVVAIFDANTGLRISNAQVEARVSETGHTGLRKKLEPMLIQGTVTYGDYFTLPTRTSLPSVARGAYGIVIVASS